MVWLFCDLFVVEFNDGVGFDFYWVVFCVVDYEVFVVLDVDVDGFLVGIVCVSVGEMVVEVIIFEELMEVVFMVIFDV